MQTVLLVCIILVTIAILIVTVYFVLLMIQVRQAAREIENLTRKIRALSLLLDLIMFLGGNIFSLITNKIKNLCMND